MIRSFKVENCSAQEFVEKVTQSLAGRELGKIASMSLAGDHFLIAFSKLGKSEVTFNLTNHNKGFSCAHKSEKIALTHRMLRSDIEAKLAKVLETLGATVEQG